MFLFVDHMTSQTNAIDHMVRDSVLGMISPVDVETKKKPILVTDSSELEIHNLTFVLPKKRGKQQSEGRIFI